MKTEVLAGDADLTELTQSLAEQAATGAAAVPVGSRFGRYRVEALLGSGGMGTVYLAEQTEPVRRRVAIKLISERRVSPERHALFELERQALAQMSHPAIAQVYDAGTTAGGVPFFAMEYIEGAPLLAYADTRGLDAGARIALMREV